MKKILFAIAVIFCSVLSFAQQQDVTKFLNIPIDGTKHEMISKLKQKGFVSKYAGSDVLTGEFNGYKVDVHVVTNNNKVYRIFLCDVNYVNETDIRIRFNNLCRQFEKNPKYEKAVILEEKDYTIPENENISYQISFNKKRYEASYWQVPASLDTLALQKEMEVMQKKIMAKYSEEQIANPTEEMITATSLEIMQYALDYFSKRSVWFMIDENYGRYRILMYYDNGYNRADGEDL